MAPAIWAPRQTARSRRPNAGLPRCSAARKSAPSRSRWPTGQATAYQVAASKSGQASLSRVFLDPGTAPGLLRVALYADAEGVPTTILTQGTATRGTGWVNVVLPPVPLAQGLPYWVAVLNPLGSGPLVLRDQGPAPGATSLLSAQRTLAAFPENWLAGALGIAPQARTGLSTSVEQVPPAVTLNGPRDGALVRGVVPLTALVDDDIPVSQVQFFVDGLPLAPPLGGGPYETTWDSATADRAGPHTLSVRAFDLAGRPGISNSLTVLVQRP